MPQAVVIDFEALKAPIPGDNPAGEPVAYDIRNKLEEQRREVEPDPKDPAPKEAKKADWLGIVRLAQETLAKKSKDLLVAARLTEALVKLDGFTGLRDGLRLLAELVDSCWARLNPPIEDGDLELRAGPFYWLDDPDKGARFPITVRNLPLLRSDEGAYSWYDWKRCQDNRGKPGSDAFEKAANAVSREDCDQTAQAVTASAQILQKLTLNLNAKMGPAAPGLISLRQAVLDSQQLMQQILHRKGPGPAPVSEKPMEASMTPAAAAAAGAPAPAAPRQETRGDLYQQLAQVSNKLRTMEPHSPIPYLIQRAIELGSLPFPDLIKELVRDAKILGELNRELGIKETPAAQPAKK